MVATLSAVLILTSAIGGLAAPTTLKARSSYSITAVRNENFVKNGTEAMLKAYRKWGLKPTDPNSVLHSALHKRQDGSVVATPQNGDVEYTCPVDIGGQTLNLDFDTGSADL